MSGAKRPRSEAAPGNVRNLHDSDVRDLIEHGEDLITVASADGRFLYVNAAWTKALGYSAEEASRLRVDQIVHPDFHADLETRFPRLLAGEDVGPFETAFRTKDGRTLWVEGHVNIRFQDGRPVSTRGIFRDVTRRKHAEAAREEYRELLEDVLLGSDLGYWEWNRETGEVHRNARWATMLGYAPEEIAPTTAAWEELLHPEDREETLRLSHQFETGQLAEFRAVYRMRCKDGTYRWIQDRAGVVRRDRGARALRISGTHADITEQKHAEEILREREERFRSLADTTPIVVFVWRDERLLYVNPATEKFTGRSRDELLHMSFVDLVHPEQRETLRERAAARWRGEEVPHRYEIRLIDAHGEDRWLDFAAGGTVRWDGQRAILGSGIDITARKEAELEYRTIIETAIDGFWIVDLRGRLLAVNDAYCRMVGYSRDELLRMSIGDLEAVETPEHTRARIEMILARGYDRFETVQARKDGGRLAVEVSARLLPIRGGVIVGFLQDISDRKRAEDDRREAKRRLESEVAERTRSLTRAMEQMRDSRLAALNIMEDVIESKRRLESANLELKKEVAERERADRALRTSEQRYRGLLEALPDLIFLQNAEGIYLDYHAPDESKLLVPAERFLGRSMYDVLPPEILEELEPAFAATVRGEHPGEVEYTSVRPTGTLTFQVRMIRTEDERVLSLVRDVTESRRTERRLRDILEHSTNLFFALSRDRRLVYVSPQSRTFFDCEPDEALVPWADFLSDHADNVVSLERFDRAIATGAPQPPYEVQIRTRRGRRLWVEVNETPVDEERHLVAVVGSLTDVSARRRAEAEKALAEQQLVQSQKLEAIDRLAGGVAHDFNNLLGVILGYGDMAQAALPADHAARESVDQILDAAERAAAITRQLLAFSRKQLIRPRSLDFNEVLADLETMLRSLVGEDIELRVHGSEGLGRVLVDPSQIQQVILNLAVNARDAMPEGGQLTIETANVELGSDYVAEHPVAVPGAYVKLAVSDTGHGMDEETRQRCLEPFFTTKPQGKGTGLGLAMVYGIVKQNEGYVWIYSEPGAGTTVKLYLPRVDVPSHETAKNEGPATIPRGRETVLVVEDMSSLRHLITRTLESSGYSVFEAADGEAALEIAARSGEVDLLLTDVVMPRLGGADLARRLRERNPGLRVLFMSGYSEGTISQHGVLEEGVSLLEKPFTTESLARAVRRALDARGVRTSRS